MYFFKCILKGSNEIIRGYGQSNKLHASIFSNVPWVGFTDSRVVLYRMKGCFWKIIQAFLKLAGCSTLTVKSQEINCAKLASLHVSSILIINLYGVQLFAIEWCVFSCNFVVITSSVNFELFVLYLVGLCGNARHCTTITTFYHTCRQIFIL